LRQGGVSPSEQADSLLGCWLGDYGAGSLCALNPARSPDFREARYPESIKQKPAWKRRVCIPAEAGEILSGIESFSYFADFRKPDSCHG
jgi:hypothetical protein